MKITLGFIAGAVQALHPKLLPDATPVHSLNQKPGRGDLRPWRLPYGVATVPAGRKTIYRMGRDVRSDSDYWLSWTTRVNAVRGYDSQDTTERTYYTGDGIPKWTDNVIGLAGGVLPSAWRQLGVPPPTVAPTLSAAGGVSANTESRYVIITFVTDKGEESAPSPVSLEIVCKTDDTITIAGIQAPPSGAFTIDRVRVYVTTSGETGETEFFFLREIAAGVTSTTDDNRPRGAVCESQLWLQPPEDLTGLTGLWNQVLAGVSEGAFRFCEPEVPYAWPIGYEILPPDCTAVAVATWGQKMLGLTTGRPLLITGGSPDSYDQLPIEGQALSSIDSVVSFGHGCAYACEDGLQYIGESGSSIITSGIFTRDQWQAMSPTTMVGGQYEGLYLCFYTVDGQRKGFMLDPLNPTGIFELAAGYEATFFDDLQDTLYVLDGTDVRKWDAIESAQFMTVTWRSKEFVTSFVNFAWLRATADGFPITVKIDARVLDAGDPAAASAAVAADFPSLITDLGAGKVRITHTLTNDRPTPAMPGNFLGNEWQIEVAHASAGGVQALVLATTPKEVA